MEQLTSKRFRFFLWLYAAFWLVSLAAGAAGSFVSLRFVLAAAPPPFPLAFFSRVSAFSGAAGLAALLYASLRCPFRRCLAFALVSVACSLLGNAVILAVSRAVYGFPLSWATLVTDALLVLGAGLSALLDTGVVKALFAAFRCESAVVLSSIAIDGALGLFRPLIRLYQRKNPFSPVFPVSGARVLSLLLDALVAAAVYLLFRLIFSPKKARSNRSEKRSSV